jgi:hypothetical protein
MVILEQCKEERLHRLTWTVIVCCYSIGPIGNIVTKLQNLAGAILRQ